MIKSSKIVFLIAPLFFFLALPYLEIGDTRVDRLASSPAVPCLRDNEVKHRTQQPQTNHSRQAEVPSPPSVSLDPSAWVARGGCWSMSGNIIAAQGVHTFGRGILYYEKRTFADFVFEVRLNKLAEDGPFGLLIRYNEKRKEGYTLLLFPHGGYRWAIIRGEPDYSLFEEPAVGMNKDVNVWNTIKVVCRGARFVLYMNGRRLTSITDHTFVSGRAGFFIASDPRQKALFEIVTLKSQ
jgi:hypothetical protein